MCTLLGDMIIYIQCLVIKLLGDLVLRRRQMRIQDFIGETTEYDKKQMFEEKDREAGVKV